MGFGTVLTGVALTFLAVLWLVPFGQYGLVDGVLVAESGTTVASSTSALDGLAHHRGCQSPSWHHSWSGAGALIGQALQPSGSLAPSSS